jgi:carbon monoxide dehydrogenase subunit G
MIKKTIAGVVVVLAGILLFALTKPDTFHVQRTVAIKAPPEKIFVLVNDFRRWGAWSPWEKMDPAMKKSFGGAASGKGAVYQWEGNDDVGKGRMEIVDSSPPAKITINLDFSSPFEAHNTVMFTLAPAGDSTEVTWAMRGPSPYLMKVMQVFASMDSMVGKDFEAGLANLKAAAER